jgi:hypothetical protein
MSFFKNLFGHQQQNKGSFTHEAIAGAAGFAGKYKFSFSH